jgi:hypothetical protein
MNNAHSIINTYPIDKNKYPLTKNVSFTTYVIKQNEYLFIPDNWFHWIYTEPFTISIHYKSFNRFSANENNNEECDLFYSNVKSNEPFTGIGSIQEPFNVDDFFTQNSEYQVHAMYSTTEDVSPVTKTKDEEHSKYMKQNKMSFFIKESKETDYFIYMGMNKMSPELSIYHEYSNLNHIIPSLYEYNYTPYVWMNLNKRIHSGLHYDTYGSIVYVLSGQKKVLMADPSSYHNLYITNLPKSKNLFI